jgi:hypothetical protein
MEAQISAETHWSLGINKISFPPPLAKSLCEILVHAIHPIGMYVGSTKVIRGEKTETPKRRASDQGYTLHVLHVCTRPHAERRNQMH